MLAKCLRYRSAQLDKITSCLSKVFVLDWELACQARSREYSLRSLRADTDEHSELTRQACSCSLPGQMLPALVTVSMDNDIMYTVHGIAMSVKIGSDRIPTLSALQFLSSAASLSRELHTSFDPENNQTNFQPSYLSCMCVVLCSMHAEIHVF